MKNALLILLILTTACFSCRNHTHTSTPKNTMLGNWQTTYIQIKMPTHMNSDSLSYMESDFSEPDATIAQSTYLDDGSFEAWYVVNGKEVGLTKGNWTMQNDSLNISYRQGESEVNAQYFIRFTSEGFYGKSIYDWDQDGIEDDTLIMKSKRIELP